MLSSIIISNVGAVRELESIVGSIRVDDIRELGSIVGSIRVDDSREGESVIGRGFQR